jgi:hypothetical protein
LWNNASHHAILSEPQAIVKHLMDWGVVQFARHYHKSFLAESCLRTGE